MVQRLLDFKAFADKAVSTAFVDEISDLHADSLRIVASPSIASSSKTPQAHSTTPRRVPNKEFSYALSDAFQTAFKSRRNKPAEMIAKYLDRAMRKGQKGKKDDDFQAELDAALGLYRFTDDKDVFRTFYHRALAKRLLLERSASDDFEKAMLKKLKERTSWPQHHYVYGVVTIMSQSTIPSSEWETICSMILHSPGISCESTRNTGSAWAIQAPLRKFLSWFCSAVSGHLPRGNTILTSHRP